MPLAKIQTSAELAEDKKEELLSAVSAALSEATGKPETYVMVSLTTGPMLMGGKPGPAAFVDVKSIGGMDGPTNRNISEKFCAILGEKLGIAGDRVYLNFTDMASDSWGWNGSTFG